MKNAIIIITGGLLLVGCTKRGEVIEGPTRDLAHPNQGVSPLPYVHVIPSERALAFQSVDFNVISNQIHYDMSFVPHQDLLKNVRLVLIDYTVLPKERTTKIAISPYAEGAPVNEKLFNRSQRYFLTMSFYEFDDRPPCPPLFEITTSIRKGTIPPQEAVRLMARGVIEEYHALSKVSLPIPQKKIVLTLN